MIETLKRCSSLKPIFIFRDMDAGSRWDGVLNFVIWISKTFKNLENNIDSFTFLFNFSNKDEQLIEQKIKDLYKRVSAGEESDPNVKLILSQIGENQINTIDFAQNNQAKLWRLLVKKKEKIEFLEDNVRLSLSQDVSKKLQ